MFMFLFFYFALAILFCYLIGKLLNKLLHRFILTTPKRRTTWDWIRRSFFTVATILLLIATFDRWYYFHDEISNIGNSKQLNLAYADQVEVETYLMNQQQAANLFEGKPPVPDKETIEHRSGYIDSRPTTPRFYLVVRIKNKGDQAIWGVLNSIVDGKKVRQIEVPPLPPHMADFKNVVLPAFSEEKGFADPYPRLESTWAKLYTSKGAKS